MKLAGPGRMALAVAALAAAVVAWQQRGPPAAPAEAAPATVVSLPVVEADRRPAPALVAEPAPPRSPEAIEHALFDAGSLRDSQPDGGWRLDAAGRLLPDIGLRRRFDQLLTTLGEATPAELGELLRLQAARALDAPGVAQVMGVWQAYLGLQQHRFGRNADLLDPGTWQPALDERIRVRRERLGPAWADAFYREEEAAGRAHIASRQQGRGSAVADAAALPDAARSPRAGDDLAALHQRRVVELGPQAAQRLQQLDADEARWQQRLAEARQHIEAVQRAAELSPVQRREAIDAYLRAAFSGGERLRAEALLAATISGVQRM